MTESTLTRLALSLLAGLLVGAEYGFAWGLGACLGAYALLCGAAERAGRDG